MKARAAYFDNFRHSYRRLALAMLVTLSLVVSPSQLCALIESSPGHSHAENHSHAGVPSDTHSQKAILPHDHAGLHHSNHQHAVGAAVSEIMVLNSVPTPHACCSDTDAPRFVASATSRFSAPDENCLDLTSPSAILPIAQNILALTSYHGRDGPFHSHLSSQCCCADRLGRAPPSLV